MSLTFVRGIHWWPVNSSHKGPVTRKTFPFYDIIMWLRFLCLKTSALKHDQRARGCKVTMHWNGGLVEARHPNMHCVFSIQHTCATDFFLKVWYDSIEKCFFSKTFSGKCYRKPSNICLTIFSPSDKERVHSDDNNCFQDKPISRGYLST